MRKEATLLHHSHSLSRPAWIETGHPGQQLGQLQFMEVPWGWGRAQGEARSQQRRKSVRFERHTGLPGPLKLDPAAVHCFSSHVAGHLWQPRNIPSSSCWQQSPSQRLERLWKLIYRHWSLWASIEGLNLKKGVGKTHRLWLSRQAFIKCTACKRERSGQTVLLGLE